MEGAGKITFKMYTTEKTTMRKNKKHDLRLYLKDLKSSLETFL